MNVVLLDTGPLIALLDVRDPAHPFVDERLGDLKGRVFTTAAIVTEAMFHVENLQNGPERLVRFLGQLQAEIADVFDPPSLRAATTLMNAYRDTLMDLGDATLVVLAGSA